MTPETSRNNKESGHKKGKHHICREARVRNLFSPSIHFSLLVACIGQQEDPGEFGQNDQT